jgi:hypothetical protein
MPPLTRGAGLADARARTPWATMTHVRTRTLDILKSLRLCFALLRAISDQRSAMTTETGSTRPEDEDDGRMLEDLGTDRAMSLELRPMRPTTYELRATRLLFSISNANGHGQMFVQARRDVGRHDRHDHYDRYVYAMFPIDGCPPR